MRHQTKAYRKSMVDAWFSAKKKDPHIVQGEFAKAHGILLTTLRNWIKKETNGEREI